MDEETRSRERATSRAAYLSTLQVPSPAEQRRISAIQEAREREIYAKYHSAEEREAATIIQKAYRGHRERRGLNGLVLDPSARWLDLINEWRYRSATAPHRRRGYSDAQGRLRSPSELARLNWRRAGQIVERASGGERSPSQEQAPALDRAGPSDNVPSLLLDQRYFLEMVDHKHRYGANLKLYHDMWQQSKSSQNFFHWLDDGHGMNVETPLCSREKLEKERIRYLTREEREDYLVKVDDVGKLRWAKNDELITSNAEHYRDSMHGIVPQGSSELAYHDESIKRQLSAELRFSKEFASENSMFPDAADHIDDSSDDFESQPDSDEFDSSGEKGAHDRPMRRRLHVSPGTILNSMLRKCVKPGTWIYVADTVGRLYVGIKSSGNFQHTSFLAGARISSAGAIGIEQGVLTYLSPLSGHYRPTTKSFRQFIDSLRNQQVDLSRLTVSKAYQVLLGMEYYGKSKHELRRMMQHHEKDEPALKPSPSGRPRNVSRPMLPPTSDPGSNMIPTYDSSEQDRRDLARLMADLHIKLSLEPQLYGLTLSL